MYDQYTQRIYQYLTNGELVENVDLLVDKCTDIISKLSDILTSLGNIAFIAVFGISLYFVLKMISRGWFRL